MSRSVLNAPHLHSEEAAIKFVEARVWPYGATCPKCGERKRVSQMNGKSTRKGLYKCYVCRKPFSVKIGTIFEDSPLSLHLWLQAIYLIAASKKGISSNQLSRVLGITLKSAWFLSHRVRLAMEATNPVPMGGKGIMVEADETYIGRKPGKRAHAGWGHKNVVFSLVQRGGKVRSTHLSGAKFDQIKTVLAESVLPESHLMTDQAKMYKKIGKDFAKHSTVNHSIGEYVRRKKFHTNTVEGFFSVFKRGMKGVYQHCSSEHLHRYLSEFDFRYNNRTALGVEDGERAENLIRGVVGKRLTYQTIGE